jgi:N-acetylglutamate synthase-like GNAT family acetyltransferase
MWAEKPEIVKVAVEKARSLDLPRVVHIYSEYKGDCDNVGCYNTFVARNESLGVVGAVTIQPHGASAELRTMGVEQDLQGKGIGSQLLAGVIEKLREDGVVKIILTLHSDSYKYKGFFEERGFEMLSGDETGATMRRRM